VSILDVGCGNGRFGLFARTILSGRLRYCGVDTSAELLAAARGRAPDDWRLIESDILSRPLPEDAPAGFDLVCCFGVMHHIPGVAQRRALLERMAGRLRPGGRLAVSFWQFGGDERFDRRVVDWSELDRWGHLAVDPAQLESGDCLLRWGGADSDPTALRYCHYCDPDEAARLVSEIDLRQVEEFRADGRSEELNLYYLLARTD
jgi:SAM-dependent methyltransferase